MILFIGNKNATAVIDKAVTAIRSHDRFLGDGKDIEGTPVFVLHKESDPRPRDQAGLGHGSDRWLNHSPSARNSTARWNARRCAGHVHVDRGPSVVVGPCPPT